MRFKAQLSLIAAAAILLGSCASSPDEEEFAAADIGPFPENYEVLIRAFVNRNHYAPDRITEIEVTRPERGYYAMGLGEFEFGWRSSVLVRSVTPHGEPARDKRYVALIVHGAIKVFRQGS